MPNKKAFLVLIFIISASLAGCKKQVSVNQIPPQQPNTETPSVNTGNPNQEIQASFAIFTNGTFRIFTAAMYHNQSADVFIESSNPNVIQVKKPGTTWGGFFSTLPFKLSDTCLTTGTGQNFCTNGSGTLKFFINGEFKPNALGLEIKKGDKLLITYGTDKPNSPAIQAQLGRIPEPY